MPDSVQYLATVPNGLIFVLFSTATALFTGGVFTWVFYSTQGARAKALGCLVALVGVTTCIVVGFKAEEIVLGAAPLCISLGILASLFLKNDKVAMMDNGEDPEHKV